MKASDLKAHLSSLLTEAEAANNIATTAEKHSKSLGGNNPYAHRFHDVVLKIVGAETKVRPHLPALELNLSDMGKFDQSITTLKESSSSIKVKDRVAALRTLRMLCDTVIVTKAENMTASPVPSTEQVLPLDVVKDTRRGYLLNIVTQANGCYEHQWFDACSVMIRKLGEILIIAVFEHKGVAHEIKGTDGHFMMLSGLITEIRKKQNIWNFGRFTVPCLDKMKEIGDRSAHNRTYISTRKDVDNVLIAGFRTAIDDLLHHAGLK